MEDSQIIDLYWQRSDRAIEETDRKYGRYCHAIAFNVCPSREDAEECVNDTWLQAWNRMPDARPQVLPAFLGTIPFEEVFAILKKHNYQGTLSWEMVYGRLPDELMPVLLNYLAKCGEYLGCERPFA